MIGPSSFSPFSEPAPDIFDFCFAEKKKCLQTQYCNSFKESQNKQTIKILDSLLNRNSKGTTDDKQKTQLFLMEPHCSNLLTGGSFMKIVRLPVYMDKNEWLAVHLMDFHQNIRMLFDSISKHCTQEGCPVMNVGGIGTYVEYVWVEDDSQMLQYHQENSLQRQKKKQSSLPACEYIALAFDSIQSNMNNESLFPTKSGKK